MRRRSFVKALGAAAAATPARLSVAYSAPLTLSHPSYKDLSDACLACVRPSEALLRRALNPSAKIDGLDICARAAADTLAACSALAGVASTGAPFALGFARTVAEICARCRKECASFPQISEAQALGAACSACADACRTAGATK